VKPAIFILSLGVGLLLQTAPTTACTIFKMTESGRTLVGNNEDWLDADAKVWFLAAEPGKHGRVLFGFENGWAQGGMNDQGLIFDGIAGDARDWKPAPDLEDFPGNLCERILEVGATVGDAVTYFERFNFPSLVIGTYVFVDRLGHTAVISYGENGLVVENHSRANYAVGFHEERAGEMLAEATALSVEAMATVLRSCRRRDVYPTQYGVIYDPHDLAVHVYSDRGPVNAVMFELEHEWDRGDHFHELANPTDPAGSGLLVDHKTQPIWDISATKLREYVGSYEMGKSHLTVEPSDDCLLLRSEIVFDAIMSFEIVPVGVDEFVARHLAIELTFHRDQAASINGLSLVHEGEVHRGRVSR
jgi:hypothetical protein